MSPRFRDRIATRCDSRTILALCKEICHPHTNDLASGIQLQLEGRLFIAWIICPRCASWRSRTCGGHGDSSRCPRIGAANPSCRSMVSASTARSSPAGEISSRMRRHASRHRSADREEPANHRGRQRVIRRLADEPRRTASRYGSVARVRADQVRPNRSPATAQLVQVARHALPGGE